MMMMMTRSNKLPTQATMMMMMRSNKLPTQATMMTKMRSNLMSQATRSRTASKATRTLARSRSSRRWHRSGPPSPPSAPPAGRYSTPSSFPLPIQAPSPAARRRLRSSASRPRPNQQHLQQQRPLRRPQRPSHRSDCLSLRSLVPSGLPSRRRMKKPKASAAHRASAVALTRTTRRCSCDASQCT